MASRLLGKASTWATALCPPGSTSMITWSSRFGPMARFTKSFAGFPDLIVNSNIFMVRPSFALLFPAYSGGTVKKPSPSITASPEIRRGSFLVACDQLENEGLRLPFRSEQNFEVSEDRPLWTATKAGQSIRSLRGEAPCTECYYEIITSSGVNRKFENSFVVFYRGFKPSAPFTERLR